VARKQSLHQNHHPDYSELQCWAVMDYHKFPLMLVFLTQTLRPPAMVVRAGCIDQTYAPVVAFNGSYIYGYVKRMYWCWPVSTIQGWPRLRIVAECRKVKVKLSLCLNKYHALKTYAVLNW